MVWLFKRRAPERHHRVADVFVERALRVEDDLRHIGQVAVEEQRQILCVQFFRYCRESADIAEHHRYFCLAGFHELRIHQQSANDFRAQVLSEGRTHFAFFFFFHQGPIEGHKHHVRCQRSGRQSEVQPVTAHKRNINQEAEGNEQR